MTPITDKTDSVEAGRHTPGPFTVRQPDAWPFDIEVVGPDGEVAWSERRFAHSTRQKNLSDCMHAVGFDYDERPGIIASLERQLAGVHLRAAAPEMLEALKACADNLASLGWHHAEAVARAAISKAEGRS